MVSLPMGADQFDQLRTDRPDRRRPGPRPGGAYARKSIRAAIEQVLGYPSYAASARAPAGRRGGHAVGRAGAG